MFWLAPLLSNFLSEMLVQLCKNQNREPAVACVATQGWTQGAVEGKYSVSCFNFMSTSQKIPSLKLT